MTTNQSLQHAIAFAQAHENPAPRDLSHPDAGIFKLDRAPWNRLLGPTAARGPVSGVIWHDGAEIAAFGEPGRADFTFSVAKTYLALLAGVAADRSILIDFDEPVVSKIGDIGFDSGNNRAVTWRHLLQQTSEWEGECAGVPEQVDRYRTLSYQPGAPVGAKGDARPLQRPGTFWEYNDVRINQLALALLYLFRRPLPEVFREAITDPLGIDEAWEWLGYEDSWVDLDGRRVQSVPGGSHWGGGVRISARAQAKIGQMLLACGVANGKRVLSAEWIDALQVPCTVAPFYGMLVWLNRTRQIFPSAPATSWFAIGHGGNITWIDPVLRSVVVVRWMDPPHIDALFGKIAAALNTIRSVDR
ncbi:MAG: class C beta-lactamase-related serine hydrolase [Betaproteobacteria bacterium]|nr:class C beta-lactamase-related serine hydrolase [Betaproteobacteria bacterium]